MCMYVPMLVCTSCRVPIIGKAGVSPPGRSAGADFYIVLCMSSDDVPFGPQGSRTTGNCKASSGTS